MKTMITEFVKIKLKSNSIEEELLAKADVINEFIRKQDGFIDAELIKAIEGNTWYFIYHIENFEKVKTVGEKIRAMKLFDMLSPLIEPESMSVSFYSHLKKW